MTKNNLFKFGTLLIVPLLLGAGCSNNISITGGVGDGGVWYSTDKGESWEQKSFISSDNDKVVSISKLNVTELKSHRKDSKIIYASTNQGIYFTENAADKWSGVFSTGQVTDFTLDPEVRGILYVLFERSMLKTTDNGRTWEQKYLESREDVLLSDVIVDPTDNGRIYVGNTSGDLIVSQDFGKSWRVMNNFSSPIREILVNPKDNTILYVGTARKGIFLSSDQGATWQGLSEFYKDFKGANEFHQLIFDLTGQSSLLYASRFGLLKSDNGGTEWYEIPTISPSGSIIYRALAINPASSKEIYYATNDALVRSFDGGQSWISLRLPTSRSVRALLVDFFNTTKVYLGAAKIKN